METGLFKNSRSQFFLVKPFTLSVHIKRHPGWRWAAHEGAGHSCWAPQGEGGRSLDESTPPWSLTWWGTGDPPSCTVPRVECIPRNKKQTWGQLPEGSPGSVSNHYFFFWDNETLLFQDTQYPRRHQGCPTGAQTQGQNVVLASESDNSRSEPWFCQLPK